jgi:RNA polymerase sigma-70 factor (ECF subfamily)
LFASLPSGGIEDKELALAFKAGQDGAYQAIHDRYSARVYGVCRRMLTSPHDAEEAAQETFLRTYQALGRFNGRYQLGAWITRIATNVCLDQLRARSRRPQHEATLELLDLENPNLVHDDGPEEIVLRNAESRRVRRILDGLPPMHRAAIVLRDFEGLTYEEVAIALGITDCQVKALIHRARQGFKRSWISAGLAALVPTRLWARFRSVESFAKEPTAQALSSTAQAAPACTNAFQQCGQYMAEKLAPVLTVALVGAAATGATPVTASQPAGEQIRRDAAKATTLLGLHDRAPVKSSKKAPRREKAAPVAEPQDPSPAPVEPPPTTEPGPEPTTAPQPAPTGAPPGEGDPSGHEPDDTATPAPVQPLQVVVGWERGTEIPKVLPVFHKTTASCAPLQVTQRLETRIHDGDASYQIIVDLYADAEDASVYVMIFKDGYVIRYPASVYTSLLERTGNNLHITYSGTYGSHPDAQKAGLPQNGTLRVDMRLDCAASSVIDEALVFGVSTPE